MKFKHVSIVARDTDSLADFYKNVFGCEDRWPRQTMSGESISRGNGVPNAVIYAAWLSLPGVDDLFLEIFEYKKFVDCQTPLVNQTGFGHISFEVEDIQNTYNAVMESGGMPLGEITDFGTSESPFHYVYVRDPEGNVVELEQR